MTNTPYIGQGSASKRTAMNRIDEMGYMRVWTLAQQARMDCGEIALQS
jgi:hypothetical protein